MCALGSHTCMHAVHTHTNVCTGIARMTVAAITPVGPVRAGVILQDGVFTQHPVYAHVEAPTAQLLELDKLAVRPFVNF